MSTAAFIHQLSDNDLPPGVRHLTAHCLVDTIGVAIGGRQAPLSRMIYAHATTIDARIPHRNRPPTQW